MNDGTPTVGIVGEDDAARALASDCEASGLSVHRGDPSAVLAGGPDLVVTVGERSLATTVSQAPSMPVAPLAAGSGVRSVPSEQTDDLAVAITDGAWTTERHTPLSVQVDGDVLATATFDVALVTTEAASISEYTVYTDGEGLGRSRADGVVVATPAGSTDYARRVRGPLLAPGTGVAVAWIAPFRTDPDRWVVRPTELSVRVERDEATVDLLIDDRISGTVGPDQTVTINQEDPFDVAVFDCSRGRFG